MKAFVAEVRRGDRPVSASGVADAGASSWITGAVRLDGRDELRRALTAAGARLAEGANDMQLIVAAWSVWRAGAAERLIGDYSFALWDHGERTLFCARDALGVRPLYWAEDGRRFVCGNVLDDVRARVSATRLHEPAVVSFLVHGFNADTATTTFAGVRRVPPGHHLILRDDGTAIVPRRHWSFPVPEPLRLRSDSEYVERFRSVLGTAVRDRLGADRAAILLSGGLDSTSLAVTARRVAPDLQLTAWTNDMGASQPPDEISLAGSAAARAGAEHHIVRDTSVPLEHLAAADFHTPEPLDEPEWASWTAQLGRMSAESPVVISGEDGDALFQPPGLWTMLRTRPLGEVAGNVLRYAVTHRRTPHVGLWLRRGMRSPFVERATEAPGWLRRDLMKRTGAWEPATRPAHRARPDAARSLGHSVWQSVLEAAHPAYTGVPLETVWPLLDVRVIEFIFAVPPVPWCQRKELMRRAFRGELPDAITSRAKAPLRGYSEERVKRWRAARDGAVPQYGEAIRGFVDTRRVTDTLQSGAVWEVLTAWRVLMLDRWLQSVERVRAS